MSSAGVEELLEDGGGTVPVPTLWAPEETAFGRVEVVSVDVVVMGVGAIIVPAIWLLSWAPLVGRPEPALSSAGVEELLEVG
jgi:hypothetical protein